MATRVQISDLTISYGATTVLSNLTWTIEPHQNYILGGKSGSGKTTLAKAIAGLVTGSGDVKVEFDKSSSLLPQVIYVSNWYQFTNLEGDRNFYYQQRYNRHQGKDT
jgi:molybdate transport system ATP-binding protein